MKSEDSTVPETIEALEAGHDKPHESARLEHLAEETDDPALRSRLESSLARERESYRGFRSAWERAWMLLHWGR